MSLSRFIAEVIKSDERFQNLLQEASKGDSWSQLRVAGGFFADLTKEEWGRLQHQLKKFEEALNGLSSGTR